MTGPLIGPTPRFVVDQSPQDASESGYTYYVVYDQLTGELVGDYCEYVTDPEEHARRLNRDLALGRRVP